MKFHRHFLVLAAFCLIGTGCVSVPEASSIRHDIAYKGRADLDRFADEYQEAKMSEVSVGLQTGIFDLETAYRADLEAATASGDPARVEYVFRKYLNKKEALEVAAADAAQQVANAVAIIRTGSLTIEMTNKWADEEIKAQQIAKEDFQAALATVPDTFVKMLEQYAASLPGDNIDEPAGTTKPVDTTGLIDLTNEDDQ